MGKNPNAKKLKAKKFKEKVFGTNIEDLEEEAARRGISVLELEQIQSDMKHGESDEEKGSEEEHQPKQRRLVRQ